ncbi:transcription factor Ouib [Drosophila tropicalis]|uniref:transcription factor Ouib n=1 Tax=Drosophila tropicalis TaxID=46794 RepID=UPI0035AC0745
MCEMSTVILKCRICLGDCEENAMLPLFEEVADEDGFCKISISQQIECCCGIRLRKFDEMPSMICDPCFEYLRMWLRFRQMCLNSEIYWEGCAGSGASNLGELEFSVDQFIVEVDNEMELNNDNCIDESVDQLVLIENDSEQNAQQNLVAEPNVEKSSSQDEIYFEEKEYDDPVSSPIPSLEPKLLAITQKPDLELKPKPKQIKDENHQQELKLEEDAPLKYECNICGNLYQTKSTFMAHKTTAHTDFKPHQCELCDKAFRQMGELRAHIRRHTGERPFKCLYCDRSFSDRSEKLRHERVHTNTRPYKCTVCEKTFTHSTILKNHSLVHSGKKNYNCDICSKSFTLLHQLKAHLQTLTHRNKASQQSSQTAIN